MRSADSVSVFDKWTSVGGAVADILHRHYALLKIYSIWGI
ncbi:hypothetical protein WM41_0253 [Corynebacterium simulans]|uniref:Uncharacterized protein n=1 Tax=Corynebacterium simulans TaxID=146827 RepID=A0ABR5VCU1_9CORY|nr:hypothetical protein WM41_0253 [Corynebacterium simulans]